MKFSKLYAFSLIEIMIASLLLAMMGVIIMTSMNSSLKAKDNIELTSKNFHLARQAVNRMGKEISMAYLSKNLNPTDPSYITQFKGYKDKLYFSAFGNVVRQKGAKESDQQVLGYFMANDKNNQQSLMRAYQPNLNNDVEKINTYQVLCPNIKKIEFSYFDNRTEKWDESWLSDAKSLQTGANMNSMMSNKILVLPSKVKISLTTEISSGNEMVFITEVEIPMTTPLDLN